MHTDMMHGTGISGASRGSAAAPADEEKEEEEDDDEERLRTDAGCIHSFSFLERWWLVRVGSGPNIFLQTGLFRVRKGRPQQDRTDRTDRALREGREYHGGKLLHCNYIHT